MMGKRDSRIRPIVVDSSFLFFIFLYIYYYYYYFEKGIKQNKKSKKI